MGWEGTLERLEESAANLQDHADREVWFEISDESAGELAADIRAALERCEDRDKYAQAWKESCDRNVALRQRVEELERALKSADESIERNKLDRDEWRDTAQKVVEALTTWQQHYAYRRSVESALAAYEKGQIALAAAKGEPLCDGSCGAKPDRPHRHFMAKGE